MRVPRHVISPAGCRYIHAGFTPFSEEYRHHFIAQLVSLPLFHFHRLFLHQSN